VAVDTYNHATGDSKRLIATTVVGSVLEVINGEVAHALDGALEIKYVVICGVGARVLLLFWVFFLLFYFIVLLWYFFFFFQVVMLNLRI
jgi:hypothetical protein